jgi:hypothetical protein
LMTPGGVFGSAAGRLRCARRAGIFIVPSMCR